MRGNRGTRAQQHKLLRALNVDLENVHAVDRPFVENVVERDGSYSIGVIRDEAEWSAECGEPDFIGRWNAQHRLTARCGKSDVEDAHAILDVVDLKIAAQAQRRLSIGLEGEHAQRGEDGGQQREAARV